MGFCEAPATMSDPRVWVVRLARELASDEPSPIPLDPATVSVLLHAAREVAHVCERLNAPLSTYAGRYVAIRVAAGDDEAAAIA